MGLKDNLLRCMEEAMAAKHKSGMVEMARQIPQIGYQYHFGPVQPETTYNCIISANDRGRLDLHDGFDSAQEVCRSCSSPATHKGQCVYCANRSEMSSRELTLHRDFANASISVAARARLAAMDRAERPRSTATSRELAKPHPWECQEDEP